MNSLRIHEIGFYIKDLKEGSEGVFDPRSGLTS